MHDESSLRTKLLFFTIHCLLPDACILFPRDDRVSTTYNKCAVRSASLFAVLHFDWSDRVIDRKKIPRTNFAKGLHCKRVSIAIAGVLWDSCPNFKLANTHLDCRVARKDYASIVMIIYGLSHSLPSKKKDFRSKPRGHEFKNISGLAS